MPDPFLSSEEYDDKAHRLYVEGDYDGALAMLMEGLSIYPNAVDLYVGVGYARLAREEFAWARRAFERAVTLDPGHQEAVVGMGETLLRFGERDLALRLFKEVERMGYHDDVELTMTMGRALYRTELYEESRDAFARALAVRPDHAEALAALGYALHRLGDETGAVQRIRRALRLDPGLREARVYLGHLIYDRGDWEGALRTFEGVRPQDHGDALAVWRVIELKRALRRIESGDPRLAPWEARLDELEAYDDPIDQLLADIEAKVGSGRRHMAYDARQLERFSCGHGRRSARHQLRSGEGRLFRGTSEEIVREMRDRAGYSHESLTDYMRRMAAQWHEQRGVEIPFQEPRHFLRAAIQAGLLFVAEEGGPSDRESRT